MGVYKCDADFFRGWHSITHGDRICLGIFRQSGGFKVSSVKNNPLLINVIKTDKVLALGSTTFKQAMHKQIYLKNTCKYMYIEKLWL